MHEPAPEELRNPGPSTAYDLTYFPRQRARSADFDGVSNTGTIEDEYAGLDPEHLDDVPPGTDPRLVRLAELGHKLSHSRFSPEIPHPKQRKFLLDFGREALYGGAAGGGKSSAILMSALQFVDVPGYAALLLRKSFSDLAQPGALMDRADGWLRGHGPRWDPTQHQWRFPSGATITFGFIERENDRLKYQGAEYQFIGFDELTQHRERDYRYLFSRLRKSRDNPHLANVPLRMRATTNPGGPGHDWVYRRFIRTWENWMRDPRTGRPLRSFHPSLLADNPSLDFDEYAESLAELDPVTRAQLLRGDWNIRPEGRLFKGRWFVPCAESPAFDLMPTVRYWDLAATDPNPGTDPDWTAGVKLTAAPNGEWIVRDIVRLRANPAKVQNRILSTAISDGYNVPVYMEQEPGASGKTVIAYYRQVLAGYTFHGNLPSGSKIQRATPVAAMADDDGVPEAGRFRMVDGHWNEAFLDEVDIFPDGFHDDQVDALDGAYQVLSKIVRAVGNGTGMRTGVNQEFIAPSAWRL